MLQYNNTTISIYTSGALGSGLPWRMFSPSRWAPWWPCAASPCPSASCSGSAAARARTRRSPPGCWICPHGKNIWRRIKNIFSPFPILHGRPAHAAVSGLPGCERLLLAAKEDSIHVQGRLGENICKTQKIFVINWLHTWFPMIMSPMLPTTPWPWWPLAAPWPRDRDTGPMVMPPIPLSRCIQIFFNDKKWFWYEKPCLMFLASAQFVLEIMFYAL